MFRLVLGFVHIFDIGLVILENSCEVFSDNLPKLSVAGISTVILMSFVLSRLQYHLNVPGHGVQWLGVLLHILVIEFGPQVR